MRILFILVLIPLALLMLSFDTIVNCFTLVSLISIFLFLHDIFPLSHNTNIHHLNGVLIKSLRIWWRMTKSSHMRLTLDIGNGPLMRDSNLFYELSLLLILNFVFCFRMLFRQNYINIRQKSMTLVVFILILQFSLQNTHLHAIHRISQSLIGWTLIKSSQLHRKVSATFIERMRITKSLLKVSKIFFCFQWVTWLYCWCVSWFVSHGLRLHFAISSFRR